MTTGYLDYLSGMMILDLLHRLVYVSVLFVPVWLACRLLGRRLPYLQMTLWSLVFLRALLPVDFSLPFSLRGGLINLMPDLFGYVEFRLRLMSLGYAASSPPIVAALPQLTWMMLVVGLWIGGSGILLARLMLGRQHYRRLAARGAAARDADLDVMVGRWRLRFRVRRRVRLVTGTDRVSPFTIGVLRPVLFLPEHLLQSASTAEIDAVVGHELAHVSRFDDLQVRIQAIVVALLWMFPPIHYASRQLSRQREIVCDQLAIVRGTVSPRAYAEGLLRIVGSITRPPGPGAVSTLVGAAEFYSSRIAAVADAARSGIRAVGVSLLLAVAALLLVVPLGPHGQVAEIQAQLLQARAAQLTADQRPEFQMPIADAALGRLFEPIPRAERVSYRFHTGLDLLAPVGAEIRAMAAGEVVRVLSSPRDSISARTGAYLIVRHGEFLAYYTYLRDIQVQPGDPVTAGQLLATLGPVPFSPEGKPAHLHLEITRDGISVDPLVLFGPAD